MGNAFSPYLHRRELVNHPNADLPALPADSSSNKLDKTLDQYLKRVFPDTQSYFEKMTKKTFTPRFKVGQLVTLEVTIHFPGIVQGFWTAASPDKQDLAEAQPLQTRDLASATPNYDQNRDQISDQTTKYSVQNKSLKDAINLLGIVILYNKKLTELVEKTSEYPPRPASEVFKEDFKKTKKLNEKFINKLRNLKEHLIKYTYFLEEVFLYYTTLTHTKLVEFSTLNEEKRCIQKIVNQMNPEELHHLVHEDAIIFPEHVLSLVLGMNDSFTDYLRELPTHIRHHQTEKYWVNNFIENNSFETNTDSENLDDALRHLGFTENRSLVLKKWLSENPYRDHQSLLYWMEAYIDNMFSYDILLNSFCRYPYNPNIVDEWQTVTVSRDNPDDSDEDVLEGEVNYINLTNCDPYNLPQQVRDHLKSLNEKCLFFHGTSHNHADNIIQNGIQLNEGSGFQDFSHNDGFYITSEIEYALDWAKRKNYSYKVAVIVFYVDPGILARYTHLDLSNDHEKWTHIIKHNRRGRDRRLNIPKPTIKEYRKADYVEGPMCSNPKEVGSSQEPKGFGRKEKIQICLKTDHVTRLFGNIGSINAVLFM
ncbi:uncharacterized protein LOC106469327 [Limulus polyphemus]|uniref:Uncharacterized protein LOC106469327 n=1 Tax=Limulus polyphemus TaxID=6850 RepID=A0ABM1BN09_LIMPO|nr:uncharacterized protein LOC106469327 [Limulus polyphemus]